MAPAGNVGQASPGSSGGGKNVILASIKPSAAAAPATTTTGAQQQQQQQQQQPEGEQQPQPGVARTASIVTQSGVKRLLSVTPVKLLSGSQKELLVLKAADGASGGSGGNNAGPNILRSAVAVPASAILAASTEQASAEVAAVATAAAVQSKSRRKAPLNPTPITSEIIIDSLSPASSMQQKQQQKELRGESTAAATVKSVAVPDVKAAKPKQVEEEMNPAFLLEPISAAGDDDGDGDAVVPTEEAEMIEVGPFTYFNGNYVEMNSVFRAAFEKRIWGARNPQDRPTFYNHFLRLERRRVDGGREHRSDLQRGSRARK